jgi:hypothetical protein
LRNVPVVNELIVFVLDCNRFRRGLGKGIKRASDGAQNLYRQPVVSELVNTLSTCLHPSHLNMPSLKSLFVLGVAALSAFAFPAPAAENALAARSEAVAPVYARGLEAATFGKLPRILLGVPTDLAMW